MSHEGDAGIVASNKSRRMKNQATIKKVQLSPTAQAAFQAT